MLLPGGYIAYLVSQKHTPTLLRFLAVQYNFSHSLARPTLLHCFVAVRHNYNATHLSRYTLGAT